MSSLSSSLLSSSTPLSARYYARLHLDPRTLDTGPTLAKLKILHEAHVYWIPYENLSLHGATVGSLTDINNNNNNNNNNDSIREPPVLAVDPTASKILDHGRGGFCYELNLLFGAWLVELGYSVRRVSAVVYSTELQAYRAQATHVVLIVTCADNDENKAAYVDVGFAEPPLHPLQLQQLDLVQETPEGMRSKLCREQESSDNNNNNDDDVMVLYWFRDGAWQPRMKWKAAAAFQDDNDDTLHQLQQGLAAVLLPETNFSRKLIVTRLTRDQKMTLAGNRLKLTGPPRFPPVDDDNNNNNNNNISIQTLASEDEARTILRDRFFMPWETTKGLSFQKSLLAKAATAWAEQ